MNFGEKDNYANFHFETLSFKKKKNRSRQLQNRKQAILVIIRIDFENF